ncbi:MAG: SIR2 family protein [Lachnospiraceae bacterium]|nr:SIR2 family protein [Lachnospiraceae bacterium]
MRYSYEEIKGKNYVKIGSFEEFADEASTDENELSENRDRFKKIIEPWLSAALQTDHLSMLVGAGLTTAVCQIASVTSSSMGTAEFGEFSEKINSYADNSAQKMGRGSANIEDQIRTAFSLLQGLEINGDKNYTTLSDSIDTVLQNFANSILSSETNLKNALNSNSSDAKRAVNVLQSFLLTFASRTATRERTHIFTTNYDRIIEYGCDMAGIKVLDRFWGKIAPRFEENPSTIDFYYHTPDAKNEFRYAEGVVRYSKIHGSLDWYEDQGIVYKDSLRFGAQEMNLPSGSNYRDHLMIYPNSMKSVETAFYPYAELFRDFSSAICRPNSTLFTYGYGFGDTHINKIIKEMLSVPSTHLVIIAYGADERLNAFLQQVNMAQVTLLIGSEFASLENLVNYYLPKAAIDTLTSTASKLIDSRKSFEEAEISPKVQKGGDSQDE